MTSEALVILMLTLKASLASSAGWNQCGQEAQTTTVYRFLPGIGWDNLENKERYPIVEHMYVSCRVWDKPRYILPDGVIFETVGGSDVTSSVSLIENPTKTRSVTAATINAQDGLNGKKSAPSGSFSEEYKEIRKQQLNRKSVTIRTEIRYEKFQVKMKDVQILNSIFRERLKSIAADLLMKQRLRAHYRAEKVIREYGTHVLTSVVTGNGIQKLLYMDRKGSYAHQLNVVSKDFFQSFQNGQKLTNGDFEVKNNNSLMGLSVTTTSGLSVLPGTKLSDWKQKVDNGTITVMDREGIPLDSFIARYMLPEVPKKTVEQLKKVLGKAILTYYKMNEVKGCTDPTSPAFNPVANVGALCTTNTVNFTFGGVYQLCKTEGEPANFQMGPDMVSVCNGLRHVNLYTMNDTCPAGYWSVPLFEVKQKHKAFKWEGCLPMADYDCKQIWSHFNLKMNWFWCVPAKKLPLNDGLLFGGFFSTTYVNEYTRGRSCPDYFLEQPVVDGTMCLGTNYQRAKRNHYFGGFYSCLAGNILATDKMALLFKDQVAQDKRTGEGTQTIVEDLELAKWPRKCPPGYSTFPMTAFGGCVIHYCIIVQEQQHHVYRLRKPPFFDLSLSEDQTKIFQPSTAGESNKSSHSGASALIGAFATLALIGSVVAGMTVRNKMRSDKAWFIPKL